jgi:DNA (cytosine-5)-methyltransferase 1
MPRLCAVRGSTDSRRAVAAEFFAGIGLVRLGLESAGFNVVWSNAHRAGQARRGLGGTQSRTFWHFTRLLEEMGDKRPPVVAVENVVGLATSHGGADLVAAISALNRLGHSIDVLTLDAESLLAVADAKPK